MSLNHIKTWLLRLAAIILIQENCLVVEISSDAFIEIQKMLYISRYMYVMYSTTW